MSLDEDTKRQKISNKATISRKNTTCMNCGQKKSGRGTLCKTCYQQKRSSYVSLSCDNCGKDFTKKKYEYDKRYEMVELTSIAAKVVLKNIKAIYRAKKCIVCNQPVPKRTMKYCYKSAGKASKETEIAMPKLRQSILPNISKNSLLFEGMQTKHTANA